jgi:membrane associated rhomboid family serine protease
MIPLRDNIRPNIIPFITVALIAVNIGAFINELQLSPADLRSWVGQLGMVPARLNQMLNSGLLDPGAITSLVSSLFLHGGWLHLIGNVWFLWLFGHSVEYCLGHMRFLLFYFTCGIIANLTQFAFDPVSTVPVIGASGAVSGILGAYTICFPRAKIQALVPLFFIFTIIEIPALLFVGIWFFYQLQGGASSAGMAGAGIAWWAHVGGFLAGVLMNQFLIKRK